MAGRKSISHKKRETGMIVKTFHVAIKAVIVKNDKALVLKDNSRFKGYDLPGGKIDKGEGITKALKRELYEELGLKNFSIKEIIFAFERLDYHKNGARLILLFYKVEAKISKIRLSDEHTQFEWISKKDLAKAIKNKMLRNEGVKIALEKVLK